MNNRFLAVAAAGLAGLLFAGQSLAGPIDCDLTPGAEAEGQPPEACAAFNLTNSGIDTETGAINNDSGFGGGFLYIGKYDSASDAFDGTGGIPGLTLSVWEIDDDDWGYQYQLTAAEGSDYFGQTIDFVLMTKQGSGSGQLWDEYAEYAYLFTGFTLDIDGLVNSFNWRGRDAYSHVTAFVRPSVAVPEPTTLGLLGLGLLGLGMAARRRRQQ
ncbi:MAG: PEP-CTERM sorting domain-containing protein [Ectothiorhodospiraceae bacterium]|nr:PEP-CTERM sorting domain-containing protein [Ectothiorhodospiraceae bacterium]